jgi:site-specific DNA recombinase
MVYTNNMSSKRAAIYARVSTDKQVEQGTSIDKQLRAGHAYAARAGFGVVAEIKDDISGTLPLTQRPGGAELMQRIDTGEVDAVIVYALDRLVRPEQLVDYLNERAALLATGIELHYTDKGKVEDSLEAELMETFQAYLSGGERKKILERMKAGKRDAALAGKWPVGNNVAYGTKKVGKGKEARLVPDEYEQSQILRMIDMLLNQNASIREIARVLESDGVPTPRHGRVWHPQVIRAILVNPIHTGVTYYGQTRTIKENGKIKRIKIPRSEWREVPVPQLEIIDTNTWQRIQDRMTKNQRAYANRKRQTHNYLLSQHIRCGACGYSMFGSHQAKSPFTRNYRCSAGRHLIKCGAAVKMVNADKAERVVWDWLIHITSPDEIETQLHALREQDREQSGAGRNRLTELETLIEKAQRKQSILIDQFGETAKQIYLDAIAKAERHHDTLVRERNSLVVQIETAMTEESAQKIREYAEELRADMPHLDFQMRRYAIEDLNLYAEYYADKHDTGVERTLLVSCELFPAGVSLDIPSWSLQQRHMMPAGHIVRATLRVDA